MTNLIDMDIQKNWKFVRTIKSSVENVLEHYPKELRYAAGMAASELVGNAIKYSEPTANTPSHLTCRIDHTQLVIEVSNPVLSERMVEEVQKRIDLAHSNHGEQVFLGRLHEILAGSHGGQLGLYRICYEGSFDLSCKYADHVLTITAVRGLP